MATRRVEDSERRERKRGSATDGEEAARGKSRPLAVRLGTLAFSALDRLNSSDILFKCS